jgi:SAM-dependent methyltransferase
LGLIAARKGFNVVALDARPIQGLYTHPRLSFVQGDFLEVSFPQSYFDVVINCSTIEHIGLVGRYQFTKEHTNGDFEAMSRLSSLMKPSGVMLLTIPVSYDAVFSPLHRVYGPKRLPRLIEGYLVEREEYWVKNPQNIWVVTDKQDALGREPQERLYGLGCFVLRRPGV